METFDTTLTSRDLDADLDVIVYGTTGRPVIAFPTFDFSAGSWETGGMVDVLGDLIESGAIQLFCVDSVDDRGWYARHSDLDYRSENQLAYLKFVSGELLRFVKKTTASKAKPILAGCGAGATNAAAALLREPKLWGGLLALSGAYDARFYSEGAVDDDWLACSPIDLLAGLSEARLRTLRKVPMAFVCGQAADERGIETQRQLDAAFAEREIEATFEYWGYDVDHSWRWWQEMAVQFVPRLLEPAGLARRKFDYINERAEAADLHLADMRAAADQRAEDVRKAEAEVTNREADIKTKVKAADDAAAAAQAAWDERNKVALQLAELDRKANELQWAADEAAHARSDAEWYAGEARERRENAREALAAAEAQVIDAEAAAQEADAARDASKAEVRDIEAAAKPKPAPRKAATPKSPAKTAPSPARKPVSKK